MQNKLLKIIIHLCFIAAFIFVLSSCGEEVSPTVQAGTTDASAFIGNTETPLHTESFMPPNTTMPTEGTTDTMQSTPSPDASMPSADHSTDNPSADHSPTPSPAAPSVSAGQSKPGNPSVTPSASAKPSVPSVKPSPTPSQAKPSQAPTIVIDIKENKAPGKTVSSGNGCYLDTSNASEGYVMAKYTGDVNRRIKVQIIADATYNYDLNLNGSFEAFPLQMGNGSYSIRFMQNTTGTSYREIHSCTINVNLTNANTPYLYPNQQVNYNKNSNTVKKSFELCYGKSSEADKVKAIYSFVTENIDYDYDFAAKVNNGQVTGYVPDVDSVLSKKKGICYDYAALTAAMLRSQGIPTMLVMGYVKPNNTYHAWNLIYLQNSGWIAVNIYFDGKKWNLTDTTYAASGGSDIINFIKNANNYTTTKWY